MIEAKIVVFIVAFVALYIVKTFHFEIELFRNAHRIFSKLQIVSGTSVGLVRVPWRTSLTLVG